MALAKVASNAVSLGGVFQGSQTKANLEKALSTAAVSFLAAKFLGKSSAKAALAAAVTSGAINGVRGYVSVNSLRGDSRMKEFAIQAVITAAAVGATRLVIGKDFSRAQAGKMLAGAAALNTVGVFTEKARHFKDKAASMTKNVALKAVFDSVRAPSTDAIDLTNEDARNAFILNHFVDALKSLSALRAPAQAAADVEAPAPLNANETLAAHQEAKVKGLKRKIDGSKTITEKTVIEKASTVLANALKDKCGDDDLDVNVKAVVYDAMQAVLTNDGHEKHAEYKGINVSDAVSGLLQGAELDFTVAGTAAD
jgi:hypothetical protein